MRKIKLLLIIAALFLSACVDAEYENSRLHDITIPTVRIVDNLPAEAHEPVLPPDVFAQDAQEIPAFNEYTATIEYDPQARTLSGVSTLRYTNRTASPLQGIMFTLNIPAMEIISITQDNTDMQFSVRNGTLTAALPRQLEPLETISISKRFEVRLPNEPSAEIGTNSIVTWAGIFLPVVGAPHSPETANYIVEIITPPGYSVAGPGSKTEVELEDTKITMFNASMVRMFSVAISRNYMHETLTLPTGVVVHLYYYTVGLPVQAILQEAADTITFLNDTVGAYPYAHFRIAEADIPVTAFSQVVFANARYLRTPGTVEFSRALAQQWFGGVVGNNRVEEEWLSSQLSSFMNALQTGNFEAVADAEDNLFYALLSEMGEEAFVEVLREYYRRFAYQIATGEDFIIVAEEVHGRSLRHIF